MIEDSLLLRRYAEDHAEDAFAELVRRRGDLVYAVALRKVGGDVHLAQDVTQRVFGDLARKAAELKQHPFLTGWLFTSTHYAATQLVRVERRRRIREAKAHAMNEQQHDSTPSIDWDKLRPMLDDLVRGLGERDRAAVLLRFFEGRSAADIGAKLQLSEEGARSRVDRALEKMRSALARRGIASSHAALGTALASQIGVAMPTGFAAAVSNAALAGALSTGSAGTALALGTFLTMSKISIGIAGIVLIAASTMALREVQASRGLRAEIASLQFDRQEGRRLRTDNERLSTELTEATESQPDAGELVRLRSRIAVLKARPEGVFEERMKSVSAWRYAGRATPADAYETMQWAQAVGDVETFSQFIAFVPRAKAKVDVFFANLPESARERFGTPEKMIAASKSPRNNVTAFQITGHSEHGTKVVVHAWTRDANGRERKGDIVLQREEDGWRGAAFSEEMTDGILSSIDPATGQRR